MLNSATLNTFSRPTLRFGADPDPVQKAQQDMRNLLGKSVDDAALNLYIDLGFQEKEQLEKTLQTSPDATVRQAAQTRLDLLKVIFEGPGLNAHLAQVTGAYLPDLFEQVKALAAQDPLFQENAHYRETWLKRFQQQELDLLRNYARAQQTGFKLFAEA